MPSRVRRVGLNALFLDPGRSGGPETYLRQLAPALAERFPQVRFSVVTTRSGATALARDGLGEAVELIALPCEEGQRARRSFSEQLLLPKLAGRRGWDVIHSLASIAPLRTRTPSVITLHDVTFMRLQTFGRITTWGMSQIVKRAAPRADALVAVSAAARDDICELLGIDPSRFVVVPHGVGRPANHDASTSEDVRRHFGLDGARVVLCVAAKRPHKNQALLIRAGSDLPDDVTIVLAGAPEPYDLELRALANELGLADRVRFADYVPDAELEGLWQLADCAAFPTFAEGFGLPVLEAMARGVPVACSDIPALHEVGSDCVRYFDPHDPQDAAAAIGEVLGDRARGAAGARRAAGFSWEAAAEGTFEAYERALAARS